ncbi:MAG TPA: hypothetical protein VFX50_04645 [Gemmatimonadales bacterium]|nr:hypothetical protein [Gemmatimonadales bacterium]
MRKLIHRRGHGLLDYVTMAAVALAPRFLPMPPRARRVARGLAAGYTAMSALTDGPLAVRRTLPWRAHGAVDKLLGAALPALPWLLGVSRNRNARNLFLGLAAVSLVVTALTDWQDEDDELEYAEFI